MRDVLPLAEFNSFGIDEDKLDFIAGLPDELGVDDSVHHTGLSGSGASGNEQVRLVCHVIVQGGVSSARDDVSLGSQVKHQ